MLERIDSGNHQYFDKIVQDYEEEFSPITGKKKQEDGLYALDANWEDPYEGYYWQDQQGGIHGFVIMTVENSVGDIADFYVVPSSRKHGIGEKMAHETFNRHKGKWQVKQIEGADKATIFWRKVIQSYTNGQYEESNIDDPKWGPVTCQTFDSKMFR